ncbi:MAG: TMEM175 family protein [Thermaceae bacterium]|nr:TMEM175 family protein [Thermaceae bacterium]
MSKGRMEAFSDGVIAIIITIMVLELKVPHGQDLAALRPLAPAFLSYVLSFVYVGIYWNNHHHLLQAAHKVNGRILWSNLFLLFWLSLIPITTAWIGESQFARWPIILYGMVLLMAAIAYTLLQLQLIAQEGRAAPLARAINSDLKGKVSLVCYASAILLAFWNPLISLGLYILVAMVWFIPDRRIEKILAE